MRKLFLIASLAACLIGAAPAHAAVEPGLVLGGNFFTSQASYQAVASTGAKWVRVFLYRDQMETSRGHYNLAIIAAYRSALARFAGMGVKVEMVVVGTPSWESGSSDNLVPPDPAGYASFARWLSGQLGGTVSAYEVWNEQDAPLWWHGDTAPAGYAALLKAAYPAFKSGSSDAAVLVGGLTGNDSDYLDNLLGQGVAGSFDGVAVHSDTACNLNSPYDFQKDNNGVLTFSSFLGYKELERVLAAHGVDGIKIWFTELGWSTSRATCDQGVWAGQKDGGVPEDQQALFLKQAYHCLSVDEADVGPSFWFTLDDLGSADTPNNRFGLIRPDGSHKPAFDAFSDYAHNGDHLTDPCGDFAGPSIAMLELGDAKGANRLTSSWSKQLHVKVQATDGHVVGRITLYLDGKKIRNFTAQQAGVVTAEMNIDQAKRLPAGAHRLTVFAKDMKGNSSSQDFTVTKLGVAGAGDAKRGRARHHKPKHRRRR